MRSLLSVVATLPLLAAIGVGCGGDSGPGPGSSQLGTLELTPASTTLFTVAPENSVALAAVAKDQDGQTMTGAGTPSFSSDNEAIAEVSDDGTVTAVAVGTARITASLTVGDVTRTDVSTVTVQAAPATGAVAAPQFAFQPAAVDIQAGGSVTWTFGPIHHDVRFTTPGAPDDIPELENGSIARTFPSNGIFGYRCSFHPQMAGSVRVH